MSASSRGWHTLSALSKRNSRVCSQCAEGRRLIHPKIHPTWSRAYSSGAAAAEAATPSQPPPQDPPTERRFTHARHAQATYRIRSGLILTRAPLLTREPSPFEAAFFLYQKRLNERLVSPFNKDMYFKTDTPPALDWALKLRERKGTVAKEIGSYKSRGVWGWNDELPVGSGLSDPDRLRATLLADSEMRFSEDGEIIAEQDRVPVEAPMPRRTEADEKGDVRRLDRAMDRTLYLVVKGRDGLWRFPTADVPTGENLHETATRVLEETAGVNMNTWIVGRVPVAHHVEHPVFAENDPAVLKSKGVKTFFIKGRIMAGQADITDNPVGVTEFKWLTREELKEVLLADYYRSVKVMMADR